MNLEYYSSPFKSQWTPYKCWFSIWIRLAQVVKQLRNVDDALQHPELGWWCCLGFHFIFNPVFPIVFFLLFPFKGAELVWSSIMKCKTNHKGFTNCKRWKRSSRSTFCWVKDKIQKQSRQASFTHLLHKEKVPQSISHKPGAGIKRVNSFAWQRMVEPHEEPPAICSLTLRALCGGRSRWLIWGRSTAQEWYTWLLWGWWQKSVSLA